MTAIPQLLHINVIVVLAVGIVAPSENIDFFIFLYYNKYIFRSLELPMNRAIRRAAPKAKRRTLKLLGVLLLLLAVGAMTSPCWAGMFTSR